MEQVRHRSTWRKPDAPQLRRVSVRHFSNLLRFGRRLGSERNGGCQTLGRGWAPAGHFFSGGCISRPRRTGRPDLYGGHELLMARPARNEGISRRSWLLAGLAIPLLRAGAAEKLEVSFDGDNLHVAAPGLHFLTGTALKRLKNAD